MKRQHFFILAALVPGLFGLVMIFAPQLMLNNSLVAFDETTRVVTQWVGFGVFSLAVINYLSRHDPGSPALRAIIIGNIIFHVLGIGFDVYDSIAGLMKVSGLLSGLIPHLLLTIGFIYYMRQLRVAKEQVA